MSSSTESWTVLRLIEWTTEYLAGHGAEHPRLDAEVLLAEARECRRIELYTAFNEVGRRPCADGFPRAGPAPRGRRAGGLPGRSARILLARFPRHARTCLIPRPETEFVLTTLLDLVGERRIGPSPWPTWEPVADVLAVCSAAELPAAQVTATDVSPAALGIARANAAKHNVQDRLEFVQTDLLEAVPAEPPFRLRHQQPALCQQSRIRRAGSNRA